MQNALAITPTEASKRIGIGRTKTYALIRDGTIPHIRIGRCIRIPIKELEKWLSDNTVSSSGGDILVQEST